MPKSFGDVLQKLMKERRLSGRALAKEVGQSYKTVNGWIGSGARMPRDGKVIKKLADYFGVSVHFLLFGEEDVRGIVGDLLEKSEIHTGLYEVSIRRVKPKGSGGKS